jgi:predicted component of type VI protein secretion system
VNHQKNRDAWREASFSQRNGGREGMSVLGIDGEMGKRWFDEKHYLAVVIGSSPTARRYFAATA